MNKDKMELKEAIEVLKNERHELGLYADGEKIKLGFAIETVLKALEEQDKEIVKYQLYLTEDVIPKKKIEDKIKTYERINKERGYLLVRESFAKKELQELLEDK